jgi:hypothetical protein
MGYKELITYTGQKMRSPNTPTKVVGTPPGFHQNSRVGGKAVPSIYPT